MEESITVPSVKKEVSKKVNLEIYPHGGHVGFVSGSLFMPDYWLEKRISQYFQSFI